MTSVTLSLNKILLYVSDISKHAGGVHGSSECLGKFSLQPLKVTYFYSSFKFRDFNLKGPEKTPVKFKGQPGTQGKELRASPRDVPATLSQ